MDKNIAIIGGTGKEGKGLAYRWAKSGHQVIIGSRSIDKARAAVEEILAILADKSKLIADTNENAAKNADVAVITVPYAAHREILSTLHELLTGKTIIDVTVPLVPPQITKVQIPSAGSAALEAREILGNDCRIASAFHNISHDLLIKDNPISCDVLVCGTDEATRQFALELVKDAGLKGWDAGPLENSIVAESLTSILIHINKRYKSRNAGIKITGVSD